MKNLKKVINVIESEGWTVEHNNGEFELQKYSPAGQDFNITAYGETVEELRDSIYSRYEDFDVSYETYLWLDSDGHGTNGAPHDMKDLYEDMEECEQYILSLSEALDKIIE